ncbi:MAG: gamma-glutamylcyclotransferase [Mongoliitalea sp.]
MNNIYYFGYASNLDIDTLQGRLPEEPTLIGIGILANHEFEFSFPNPDGSARANIHEKSGLQVIGLLFQISESSVAYFLNSEPGYDFVEKQVLLNTEVITAYTFQSKIRKEGLLPNQDYVMTILRGGEAQGIAKSYLAEIKKKSQTS